MKTKSKPKPKRPKYKSQSQTTESSPSDGDFSFALARIAMSQICHSVGFSFAQTSALETLTAVAGKYIEAIGRSSAAASSSANRTDSNLFDVAYVLRDLRSGTAISAAAATATNAHHDRCAIGSADLAEIADFANLTAEIPFAKPVPQPPPQSGSGCWSGSVARPCHVPEWLPDFPRTAAPSEERRRRREEEELWENCVGRCESGGVVVKERSGEVGLRKDREKVRFKLGLRRRYEGSVLKCCRNC